MKITEAFSRGAVRHPKLGNLLPLHTNRIVHLLHSNSNRSSHNTNLHISPPLPIQDHHKLHSRRRCIRTSITNNETALEGSSPKGKTCSVTHLDDRCYHTSSRINSSVSSVSPVTSVTHECSCMICSKG